MPRPPLPELNWRVAKGENMGRIRSIKPEFPQSESMGKISRDARLLFIMLWTIVDDEGRTRAASRMLASLLFPFDDDAPELIEEWLNELEDTGAIVRYVVDGSTYLYLPNWLKHQKIDKATKSRLPEFREELARPRRNLATDLGSRIMDLGSKKEDAKASSKEIVWIDSFERFYAAYPVRKGRGQAERAYQAAIKSGVDHETIITGATAYAVQCQRNGTEKRYIKHPSTWLNGKCWLDEHSTDAENCGGTGRANTGSSSRRGSILEAAAAAMGDGSGDFGLFAGVDRGGPGYAQGDAGQGYRGTTLDLPAIEPPRDYQGPDAHQADDQERQFDAGRDFDANGDLRR